ncbi:hypothetical protein DAI22_06g069466 [Oryza sativa Japonica Group]|nr:hypothetical protein DAI22_06g069466 [Oryza sativa Japonica Group]
MFTFERFPGTLARITRPHIPPAPRSAAQQRNQPANQPKPSHLSLAAAPPIPRPPPPPTRFSSTPRWAPTPTPRPDGSNSTIPHLSTPTPIRTNLSLLPPLSSPPPPPPPPKKANPIPPPILPERGAGLPLRDWAVKPESPCGRRRPFLIYRRRWGGRRPMGRSPAIYHYQLIDRRKGLG